jgi:tetratricopeptide (TPR) repeat protein
MTYADSCYEQENFQKAFDLNEKILELDSTNLDAKNDKADLLNLLGRPDESLRITDSLISANGGDKQAWATKGESQMIKGEIDKAITSLENSTLIDPTFEVSWFSLAKAYSHENRVDDALDSLLVATSLEPDFLDELDEPQFDNIRSSPRFEKLKEKQSNR